jgi:hypothetical protein
MTRRDCLALVPAGFWSFRWHVLCRYRCANGGVLLLMLKGEPWKLTERERELVLGIAKKLAELEPAVLQQRLPGV